MPTDETRRLLKAFGVAVTTLEDAVQNRAPADEIAKAEHQARALLSDLTALLTRLRDDAAAFEA